MDKNVAKVPLKPTLIFWHGKAFFLALEINE